MAASTEEHAAQIRRRENVEISFAQRLAGNEKKIRDKAIKKLNQWIEARSKKSGAFGEEDLLKLWKGLFYCMWMSDKPLIQEELADKIGGLTHSFASPSAALGFFDACILTIKREWAGIDYLRIDKFMMMVRKCFTQALIIIKQSDWDESLVDEFLQILKKTPLNPDDWACPNGLRIHISDIYREELGKIGADELSKEQVLKFIDPFCALVTATKSVTLSKVMLSEFFAEIVVQSDVGMEGDSDNSEDEGIQSGGDQDDEEKSLKDGKKKQKRKGDDVEEEEGDEDGEEQEEEEDVFVDKWEEHLAEIPTLKYDYAAIADRLVVLAGEKGTLGEIRRRVYGTVKKFRDLSVGFYPMPDLHDLEEKVMKEETILEREVDPNLRDKVHQRNLLKKKRRKRRKKMSESEGDEDDAKDDDDEEEDDEEKEGSRPSKAKKRKRNKQTENKDVKKDAEKPQEGGEETTEKKKKKRKRRKKQKSEGDEGPAPAKVAKVTDGVKGQSPKSKKDVSTEDVSGTDDAQVASTPKSAKKQKRKGKKGLSSGDSEQEADKASSDVSVSPVRSSPRKKQADKTPSKEEEEKSVTPTSTPKSSKKSRQQSKKESNLPSSSEDTSSQEETKTQAASSKKTRRKSKKLQEEDVISTPEASTSDDTSAADDVEQKTPSTKAQSKSAKKKGRKSQLEKSQLETSTPKKETTESSEEKEASSMEEEVASASAGKKAQPKSAKKKGRKSQVDTSASETDQTTSTPADKVAASPVEKEVTPVSKRTRRKSAITKAKLKEVEDEEGETIVIKPKVARRSRRLTESDAEEKEELTAVKPSSTPGSTKKRVQIALSQNEVSAAKDYRKRIQKSPGIPFDSSKRPTQPALKFTPPTTRARARKATSTKKKR